MDHKKQGSKNNRKGRRFERELRIKIEKEPNWKAFRLRGVRGTQLSDLFCINPVTKQIKLVECKNYKQLSLNRQKAILEPLMAYEGTYTLTVELARRGYD